MKKFVLLIGLLQMFLPVYSQQLAVNQLSAKEFSELKDSGNGTVLDVRTKREFKNGHLENSGQLNYYALNFSKRLLLLPKNEPIYLYCNTGYRSERAAKILLQNGFTQVYNLEHGILEWNLNKLPVVVEPDAKPDVENKVKYAEYQQIIKSDTLVFIDFYAPWCAPCRKMMPMTDSLKVKYHQRIKIVKINIDASKKLVRKLKIIGVPYLVLFRKGELLFSRNGMIGKKELEAIFEEELQE